jgi:predicted methyltransferase
MNIILTLWKIINPLALKLIKNESAKQFLSLSPGEQKKLLTDLSQYRGKVEVEGKVYQKWSFYLDTIRQHFQLPCTVQTRKARAELLESLCPKDGKILLLGDDDLVSWELAQRNFTAVTASDCDGALLDHIKDLCSKLDIKPRLVPGDFSDEKFDPGMEPDVVCIDPPYNLKWTQIFLAKALQSVKNQDKAVLLMMINPHCFSAKDWHMIISRMTENGFELAEHRPHFNAYPLRGLSSVLLRWGLRMISAESKEHRGPLYFSSDLYVFQRNRLAKAVVKSFPKEVLEVKATELKLVNN